MHVHVGIVTEKKRFIHSCMIRGAVIEEKITNKNISCGALIYDLIIAEYSIE